MRSEDFDDFRAIMQDLCTAYDRPFTDDRCRVFYETLKHMHIADVRRAADSHRKNIRKFPTPKDLLGERRARQSAPARKQESDDDGPMSRWACAANKILLALAYCDIRRGFLPLGEELMRRCLVVRADYARMAEDAEREGYPMSDEDFIAMCREGFERLLGTRIAA